MNTDDPQDGALEALRQAYRSLPVPEATPALEAPDPATAAVLDWMRAAFAALPLPPTAAAPATRLHRHALAVADTAPHDHDTRAHRPPAWQRQLAAAAVLLAFLGLLKLPSSGSTTRRATPAPLPTPPVATAAVPGPDQLAAPVAVPEIPGFRAADPGSHALLAVAEDHVVMRSGPVQLLLFTSPSTTSADTLPRLP